MNTQQNIYSLVTEIKTWDCETVQEIKNNLESLELLLSDEDLGRRVDDVVDITSLPTAHRDAVDAVSDYPVWCADKTGRCLTSGQGWEIVNLGDI